MRAVRQSSLSQYKSDKTRKWVYHLHTYKLRVPSTTPVPVERSSVLVSVFCCNFSIYQWAQRSSIIITRAQKHSPGSGNNLFIHHYKQTQGMIWYDLFSNKFEIFKIDLCFSYLFWWYFHKIKKTTISSAQRRSTLLLGDRTSVSSLDSAIADCQKWRLCGQLKASAYT